MRLFFLPFLALMIFCFLFITSPNDTDNIKLMYYAYAGAVVVISAWMAKLIVRYRKLQSIVGLAVLACIASGVLSIVKVAVMSWRIFSPEEIEVGTFARTLPAKSLFLTGQNHNQPVLCFAGKSIVLGYDFWIVSHGYERSRYDAVLRDLKKMYAGGPQAEALLQKYGVKYVYIGPPERTELHANSGYFDTHHAVVFRNKEMTIYEARAL